MAFLDFRDFCDSLLEFHDFHNINMFFRVEVLDSHDFNDYQMIFLILA